MEGTVVRAVQRPEKAVFQNLDPQPLQKHLQNIPHPQALRPAEERARFT